MAGHAGLKDGVACAPLYQAIRGFER